MKKTIFSFIMLMMITMQGFAGPVDSLANVHSRQGTTGDPDCLMFVDGEDPSTVDPWGGGTGVPRSIAISPESYTFSNVEVGKEVTKTFTITGYKLSNPINLVAWAETHGGEYSITPKTLPARGGTVKVTYKPTQAGSSSALFTFKSGSYTAKITVNGKAIVRSIKANPSTVTFTNVKVGSSLSKKVYLTGTNLTNPISLASISETIGGEFSVSPTVLPASGGYVTVTYKPSKAGSSSAVITYKSGNAIVKFTAKGTAVMPTITTSTTSLSFTPSIDNRTFTVKGTNLLSGLTLTLENNTNGYFKISPTSISMSNAEKGVVVNVLFIPKGNVQRATAKIRISGGGAVSKTVNLSYSNQLVQISAEEPEENEAEALIEEGLNEIALDAPANSTTDASELVMNSKVYADGQNIVIESANEQSAVISDISGHARRVSLNASTNVIPVNGSGMHIVKVGDKTTKVMIK